MASEEGEDNVQAEPTGKSKMTSSVQPLEVEVPANSSLFSQLGEAIWNPQSPLTASPEGSAAIMSIILRLESIELESRDLLTQLFSMVQTDARLERYIQRRLQDHRLSQMWELVEQIIATQCGSLDIDSFLEQQSDYNSASNNHSSLAADQDKEVKDDHVEDHDDDHVHDDDAGGDVGNERFKVGEFDKDKPRVVGGPRPVAKPSSSSR